MSFVVRKMQSRDQDALADLFPQMDEGYFEDLYLDQLQNTYLVFVASHKPEDGEREYFGFAQLLWASPYTQFWRYNTAQINALHTTLHADGDIINALIAACEDTAHDAGHPKIGIALTDDTPHHIYDQRGYTAAGQEGDDVLWWLGL